MSFTEDEGLRYVFLCYLQLANALEKAQRQEQAAEILRLAVQQFPKAPSLNLALGRWYLTEAAARGESTKQIDESIRLFSLAIANAGKKDPLLALVYEHLGVAYRLQEKYVDAIQALEEAKNRGQDSLILWVALGDCLSRNGPTQDFSHSLLALNKALEHAPNSVDALRLKARVLRERKEFDDALTHYDKALKSDPSNAIVLTGRAECFKMLGRPERALKDLDAALRAKPDFSLALVRRAGANMMLRRYKDALKDLCAAVDRQSDLAGALASRGLLYQLLGDYTQSLLDLDIAIFQKAHPVPLVLTYRGETYRLKGDVDKALADFDNAVSLDKQCVAGYTGRAECYFQKKEYAKALEEFSKVLQLEQDRGVHQLLGDYKLPLSDFDSAIKDKDYLLRWVLLYRGETYRVKGDIDKALADFNDIVALDKQCVAGYAGRAECYYQKEEYLQSLEEFSRVLELERDRPEALLRRADIWYRLGDHKSCFSDLDKVSTSSVGQMIRGRSLMELNRLEEALEYFDQALKSDSSLILASVSRGEVLVRLARYKEGLEEFEKALKSKPLTDWILYDKAMTFRKLGFSDQEQKNLVEAIIIAEDKRSSRPDSYRDAFNLALYYLASGEHVISLRTYDETLKSSPPSWFLREARRDVNNFLSLFPSDMMAQEASREILPKFSVAVHKVEFGL